MTAPPREPLLPCPFCGGSVDLEQAESTSSRIYGKRQWWGVVCRNTMNRGGTCAVQIRPSASKEAAIARWNMRAAPAPSADAVHGPFESMDDLTADLKAPAAQPAEPELTHEPIIHAQHEETGRMWTGPRSLLPRRYQECAEPTATDDLVRDLNDWVRTFAYDAPLRRCIERGADTIVALRVVVERQAREIARVKVQLTSEITAALAERDALRLANIDAANLLAECSDMSVDIEKYRGEIAALRMAVKDDAQWAQDNERLTSEFDRVKAQLTSEITDALAERDAAIGAVNVLKNSLSACIAERDAVLRQMQSFNAVVAERDAKIVSISTERDALKRELEITCAHLGLDKLLADRDALRECVKAADAMRLGLDCPMCDNGKLRNPAKEHWDTCAFANYDAARAKVRE